jgi:predicted 3-demethylubiquinone-9 3-methyltransferase (glyoxalase superfamily)
LNSGPHFKFTEAISFAVNCETQEEMDELWEELSEGGTKVECGSLKGRHGVHIRVILKTYGETGFA